MARPQVPDSTVLIELARRAGGMTRFVRGFEATDAHICSVVLAELHAGTRSQQEARDLNALFRLAHLRDRLITPTPMDWVLAGRLINRWSRLHGAIEPRDHLADVLIVISAARLRGDVVSANRRPMAAWVELARRGGLDVGLTD